MRTSKPSTASSGENGSRTVSQPRRRHPCWTTPRHGRGSCAMTAMRAKWSSPGACASSSASRSRSGSAGGAGGRTWIGSRASRAAPSAASRRSSRSSWSTAPAASAKALRLSASSVNAVTAQGWNLKSPPRPARTPAARCSSAPLGALTRPRSTSRRRLPRSVLSSRMPLGEVAETRRSSSAGPRCSRLPVTARFTAPPRPQVLRRQPAAP